MLERSPAFWFMPDLVVGWSLPLMGERHLPTQRCTECAKAGTRRLGRESAQLSRAWQWVSGLQPLLISL